MTGRLRRLAGRVAGQAGAAPAALAVVALLTALVATAGPAEVAAAQDAALHRQLASLTPLGSGVAVSAQWEAYGSEPATLMGPARLAAMSGALRRAMRPALRSAAGPGWQSATSPAGLILDPPPSTVLKSPPRIEVAYDSGLPAHARLVSGTMPAAVTASRAAPPQRAGRTCPGRPGRAAARAVTVQVAVTVATAARFGLHPGSRLAECAYQAGDPAVTLLVTGVIRPRGGSPAYWTYDPALTAPQVNGGGTYLFGGAFTGPGELTALLAAWSGASFQGTWFFPLQLGRLTAGGLPPLLAGIAALAASPPVPVSLPQLTAPLRVSSPLAGEVGTFAGQQQVVAALAALELTGLFLAGAVLALVCAGLAAGVHAGELAVVRARGGSTRQLAARMAGHAWPLAAAGLTAGTAAGASLAPAQSASWLLAGAAAAVILAGPPAAAAWQHRRAGPPGTGQRGGRATAQAGRPARRRLRRAVAELTVLAVAAGALAELRHAGAATGVNPYLDASPVLVAAAAVVVIGRSFPAVVAALSPLAARRRGPVGFLGTAQAARSRLGAALPALAMVLTLTVAAFGAVIAASIGTGQAAASWRQTGADVAVQAPGNAAVPAGATRAVGAIAGITHATAVYSSGSESAIAPTVVTPTTPAGGGTPVDLLIVNPASYAALAAATPWPGFPARLLARPARGGPVPVLASEAVARAARGGRAALAVDGIRAPIRVAGGIGTTPAAPAGGALVVLPSWAEPRFPAIPGPDLLLATGAGASAASLRAVVARRLPGGQLTLRRQVLAQLAGSPAQRAGARIFTLGTWAAGALSVVAAAFALAATAGRRRQLLGLLALLGMARRQARALALADALPLAVVAAGGMAVATTVLALAAGPAIDLTVFTGSLAPAPVRLTLAAVGIPAAAVVAFAAAFVAAERVAPAGDRFTVTLRQEEAP